MIFESVQIQLKNNLRNFGDISLPNLQATINLEISMDLSKETLDLDAIAQAFQYRKLNWLQRLAMRVFRVKRASFVEMIK